MTTFPEPHTPVAAPRAWEDGQGGPEKEMAIVARDLAELQNKIAALLVQRDEAQKKQIDALVKTYSTMKPKDAARIFNALPDDVLLPVAAAMKADVLALVLAGMASDNAKALTVKLANRLALPQTADAVAPASAPSTPPPAPAAGREPGRRRGPDPGAARRRHGGVRDAVQRARRPGAGRHVRADRGGPAVAGDRLQPEHRPQVPLVRLGAGPEAGER